MATKSITKNVDIRDEILCRAQRDPVVLRRRDALHREKDAQESERKSDEPFVDALENAEKKHAKEVSLSRSFKEVKGSKIKELFGDNK